MTTKKIMSFICAAAIIAGATGCAASDESENTQQSSSSESTVSTNEKVPETSEEPSSQNEELSTKTVRVTEINGDTISGEVGEITRTLPNAPNGDNNGTPPEAPSGDNGGNAPPDAPNGDNGGSAPPEAPNGDSGGNTPPEAPNGDNGGNAPPDAPNGDNGGNTPPEAPGGMSGFETNGENVEFRITESTVITVEFLQGSGEGSSDDIAVGNVLDVTLDGDGNALEIIVRNLNKGGGFGGSSEVTNGTSANTISENGNESDTEYSSSGDDENALRVDGAEVTLNNITVNKNGGSSSNTENGDFYGQNAGLLALGGANVTITNSTFDTDAVNGNAVFSCGEGTVVNISDSVIRTKQNNSGGIQTTGGGTTYANNLDVETSGNSSAAIRSDRGGGTVFADGGSFVTNGTGSPAIYCTADITATGATLTANASEGVVVEGKNSVTINDCTVTSDMKNTYNGDSNENIHCIMIYQSMSGDADLGKASLSATGGSVTALSGDMFYITNTDCDIALSGVEFTLANDTFLRVEGNDSSRGWGTKGANGGDVTLSAVSQKINGNILVDEISSLDLNMADSSELSGAINPDNNGGEVNVTLDDASTWTLTADSYITSFDGDLSNIVSNGCHLYVDGNMAV